MDRIYSVEELLKLTGISRATLYRQIEVGYRKSHTIGRRTVFYERDVAAWLKAASPPVAEHYFEARADCVMTAIQDEAKAFCRSTNHMELSKSSRAIHNKTAKSYVFNFEGIPGACR